MARRWRPFFSTACWTAWTAPWPGDSVKEGFEARMQVAIKHEDLQQSWRLSVKVYGSGIRVVWRGAGGHSSQPPAGRPGRRPGAAARAEPGEIPGRSSAPATALRRGLRRGCRWLSSTRISSRVGGALAAILLNRLLDGLDGALARRRGLSDAGGFLDISLDFLKTEQRQPVW
jgi:hypothetical protein